MSRYKDMTTCPICQERVSKNAPICPHCGEPNPGAAGLNDFARRQAAREEEQAAQLEALAASKAQDCKCYYCHKSIVPDFKVCPYCGNKVIKGPSDVANCLGAGCVIVFLFFIIGSCA